MRFSKRWPADCPLSVPTVKAARERSCVQRWMDYWSPSTIGSLWPRRCEGAWATRPLRERLGHNASRVGDRFSGERFFMLWDQLVDDTSPKDA